MSNELMSEAATLFKGLDTEKWSIRPEPRFFNRLDEALRHAVESLSSDEKHGAYIRLEKDHSIIRWPEIEALYKSI